MTIWQAGKASRRAFLLAQHVIPGGVNSPVRAFARLGGEPPVIERGEGPWLWDIDGKRYLDFVLSWGPLVAGHAHPKVVAAVQSAAERGLSFGAPTEAETTFAQLLCSAHPGMEMVRAVSSGTEATMSALRLARAATGRDLVIKCDGCYHGHADHLLVAAGSGAATLGSPDSAGVPKDFAKNTIVVPFNDAKAVEAVLQQHGSQVAAIIIEPVAGNMGFIPPKRGYLSALRKLCTANGSLLVFDEVMTGFRVGWGGAQVRFGVQPDLTCLGKVIGGGMPLGAYGGRRDLMQHLAPLGACYQAGTLSGNPISVQAGLATLALAKRAGFYDRIQARMDMVCSGLRAAAQKHRVPFQCAALGSMWGFFFSSTPVRNFTDAAACRHDRWATWVEHLLNRGYNMAPSPFEAAFAASVHTPAQLKRFLKDADAAFAAVAEL
jgi:glutamate-1-semialdehyde 2,1-aminomutase